MEGVFVGFRVAPKPGGELGYYHQSDQIGIDVCALLYQLSGIERERERGVNKQLYMKYMYVQYVCMYIYMGVRLPPDGDVQSQEGYLAY